jgi:two-component system sensor histidine kinase DctS
VHGRGLELPECVDRHDELRADELVRLEDAGDLEGLVLGRREGELDIVSAVTADVVEVRVCDNGPGVAPAMANKLFDAFSTTKQNGTGLGLAMSRTLIESHKGSIGTRPGAAGGAVFFIGLPALTEGAS